MVTFVDWHAALGQSQYSGREKMVVKADAVLSFRVNERCGYSHGCNLERVGLLASLHKCC